MQIQYRACMQDATRIIVLEHQRWCKTINEILILLDIGNHPLQKMHVFTARERIKSVWNLSAIWFEHCCRGLIWQTSESSAGRFADVNDRARILEWDESLPVCKSLQPYIGRTQASLSVQEMLERRVPVFPGGLLPSRVWRKASAGWVWHLDLTSGPARS